MSEILSKEQVALARGMAWAAQSMFNVDMCDSHEALRARVAELEAKVAEESEQRDYWQHECSELQNGYDGKLERAEAELARLRSVVEAVPLCPKGSQQDPLITRPMTAWVECFVFSSREHARRFIAAVDALRADEGEK